jgi:hypothetical protein
MIAMRKDSGILEPAQTSSQELTVSTAPMVSDVLHNSNLATVRGLVPRKLAKASNQRVKQ